MTTLPAAGERPRPPATTGAAHRAAGTLAGVIPELPRLRVRTRRIADPGELLRYADPSDPALVLRRGDGVVGRGRVWRGEFSGADRIAEARAAWAGLVAGAAITDDAQVPGSGLIAFGAFAFSAASDAASVLQVPRRVVGRRGGIAFVTEIALLSEIGDEVLEAPLPDPDAEGTDARTALADGVMDRPAHRAALAEAIARIEAGDLEKVVIARDATGRIRPDADRRTLVRRLAAAYPETWTYAVDGLTGASPEMLVRVLGSEVATRVLAGTVARGGDADEDAAARAALAGSAKNLHEHRLAVDSALESLRALDSHDELLGGLTASPEPFVLGLPNVWHLASDIRGTLPAGASILDLVEALHPTAAVGGTPRAAATAAIDELEPFDRRRYAGPAGWVSADGDGEWVIALRCAEIDPDGGVTAYAGGGIVETSEIDEEWCETIAKLAPIADALR